MRTKISRFSKIQFFVFIAVFLLGNSVFAEELTRMSIEVTINGSLGEDDYLEYWYKGEFLRNIKGSASLSIYTEKNVKFIAHGSFKDWAGSSCGKSTGNILAFETTGDCIVTANYGVDADTDRRQ